MPNPQGSLRKGLNFVVALIIKDIVLLVQTELVLTTIFIYYSRAVLSESESIVFWENKYQKVVVIFICICKKNVLGIRTLVGD